MDPINKLAKACMDHEEATIEKMMKTLNVTLKPEEKELKGKKLLKSIIRKWIDAAEAILEMMVTHLPSPKEA